ncbi:MAG TPA: hypothetical protein VGH38_09840 [Bryobacteraceae bacterium]
MFSGAAKWAMATLTAASLVSVVCAAIFFFTSHGLHALRPWSRILGILVAIVLLLISLAASTALRRPLPLAISTIIAALSIYTIWILGWRFA